MRISFLFLLMAFVSTNLYAQQLTCNAKFSQPRAQFFQDSLMKKYDIKYQKLDLNVEPNSRFISGSCFYNISVVIPLDTFAIEFKDNMTLDSVVFDNEKVAFTRSLDHIYVVFPTTRPVGSQMTAKFFYSGTVINGLAYGNDASKGFIYAGTLSESFQAREWYPAKQWLDYKIDSTDIWLTTTNPYIPSSNGLLKSVVALSGNKSRYQWSTGYPMNYYMLCFTVGNFSLYKNYAKPTIMGGDSILIEHFIVDNPSYFAGIKATLDFTPFFLEKMSELFGLYPFYKEKYGHQMAYIGGGMEHQTNSTMQGFNFELVAHELAHQWFGDNVTCANWQDIWINEGFATYLENLMRQLFPSLAVTSAAQQMTSRHNDIMSYANGSVYITVPTFNEGRIFSGRLSYNKGCAAIHTLRFEMQNDSLFFKTLKTFQQQFKDSFATTADFKRVAEQVSGKNLTDFFNQWIYGEGYPTYDLGYYKYGSDTLVINVNQTTSWPTVTPLFTGLMEYKITSAQGDTTIILSQSSNFQTFRIPYSKTTTGIVVDPNNWIVNKVGSVLSAKSIDFSGRVVEGQARLSWIVKQQTNTKQYEVERSEDGIYFSSVGIVLSTLSEQYSFVDNKLGANNYYRLKMVDEDGTFSYSEVVYLRQTNSRIAMTFDVRSTSVRINVIVENEANLNIDVFNVEGMKMMHKEKRMSAGSNMTMISLGQLPKGIYVVHATNGQETKILKVFR